MVGGTGIELVTKQLTGAAPSDNCQIFERKRQHDNRYRPNCSPLPFA